jgi:alpha-ketoglutarate-dependent taurine dioxygenase
MESRPIDPRLVFGQVLTGVDLAEPLTPATWRQIEDLLHQRGVLVFKEQGHLTVEQQKTFASRWGHMKDHAAIPVMQITNVTESGDTLLPGTTGFYNLQGNEGW